jgi:diketogulonate reductase-like aldo/keto reductase
MKQVSLSRRKIVRSVAAVSAALALNRFQLAAATEGSQRASITKPIPSTGERIPVIGLGTNQYSVKAPEEIARLQIVLETMLAQGGSVVDTARVYGRSEEVIGELVRNIGRRNRFFIVTKTPIFGELRAPDVEIQASFDRL